MPVAHAFLGLFALFGTVISDPDVCISDDCTDAADESHAMLQKSRELSEDSEMDKAAQQNENVQAVKKHGKAGFKAADGNGDGSLQSNEVHAFVHPDAEALTTAAAATMESKDVNSDGKLTEKEFGEGDPISEKKKAEFGRLDLNADGFVDLEELKAAEAGAFETTKGTQHIHELETENPPSDNPPAALETMKKRSRGLNSDLGEIIDRRCWNGACSNYFTDNRLWLPTDDELLYMANWAYYKTKPMYNWPATSYPQGPTTDRWWLVGSCHWEYRNCDYFNSSPDMTELYTSMGLTKPTIDCVQLWHNCWDDVDDYCARRNQKWGDNTCGPKGWCC
jgi:Ca2+-binding EF-hand superfamily protein